MSDTKTVAVVGMNYEIVLTHISDIRVGDTVDHLGEIKTVCRNNLKRGFMGRTLFGDSYRLGTLAVRKLNIITHRAALRAVSGEVQP